MDTDILDPVAPVMSIMGLLTIEIPAIQEGTITIILIIIAIATTTLILPGATIATIPIVQVAMAHSDPEVLEVAVIEVAAEAVAAVAVDADNAIIIKIEST